MRCPTGCVSALAGLLADASIQPTPTTTTHVQEAGQLDGVVSYCEMAQPLVARLTERLGLPGNSPTAVDAARDKHASRAVMQAAGLPTPRNFLIANPRQLQQVGRG